MEARGFVSRTTIAHALAGHRFPTLAATIAVVRACGGDVDSWRNQWHQADVSRRAATSPSAQPRTLVQSALPTQALADGADPERARCHHDAVTVHARKVAMLPHRTIGQIELRYSPTRHAAWPRFQGYPGFEHWAEHHPATVVLRTRRRPDGVITTFSHEYVFDVHWGDILLTGAGRRLRAEVVILSGDQRVAEGGTDWLLLA
ncbi:DUF2690 domain-containing protein [Micromonospora sediminicola]|nr:DUF2690 domain-containing protein [Micromonospora sediminicola]